MVTLSAIGPRGEGLLFTEMTLGDTRRLQYRAYGRRAPADGWRPGRYSGEVRLTRGETLIGTRQAYVRVAGN